MIAELALVMVGFLLGGRLRLDKIRSNNKELFAISIAGTLGTTLVVAIALIAFGVPGIAAGPVHRAILRPQAQGCRIGRRAA